MRLPFGKRPRNGANGSEWQVGNSRVRIGRFTYGERNITVREWGEGLNLTVGSFCSIADEVTVFLGGNHRTDWITTFPFGFVATDTFGTEKPAGLPFGRGEVIVGHDVWIGQGVTIMSGVTIGDGAVIATKAVVTTDVPPYTIAAGHPAQAVKRRFDDDIIAALLRLRWWDLPNEDINEIQKILCAPPTRKIVEDLVLRYRGGS